MKKLAVIALLALTVSLTACGGDNGKNTESTQSQQTESQMQTESETLGTENLGTELETEALGTEMETETLGTELETEIPTETESQTETQTESEAPSETESESQAPVSTKGTKNDPYLEIPDLSDMSVTTVEIPAGGSYYYGIQRVGGMWLEINDSDAYVIESDGTKHSAKSGSVEFTVENALAGDFVMFQIGNNGASAKSFKIHFANINGSYQNPEKVKSVGTFQKSLSAGNEVGYYYRYSAESSGTLKFYVEGTKASGISVTNKNTSANRTTGADSKTDESGRQYVEMEVSAGDDILILIHAEPDKRGKYPATDITWEMKY